MNQNNISVEEILDEIQFIFNDILGYSPDGEIASLVTHGTGKMLKLRRTHHEELQKAREEEREVVEKAWSYCVKAMRDESGSKAELIKCLTNPQDN